MTDGTGCIGGPAVGRARGEAVDGGGRCAGGGWHVRRIARMYGGVNGGGGVELRVVVANAGTNVSARSGLKLGVGVTMRG